MFVILWLFYIYFSSNEIKSIETKKPNRKHFEKKINLDNSDSIEDMHDIPIHRNLPNPQIPEPVIDKHWVNYDKIKNNGAMGKEFIIKKEDLNAEDKEKYDIGWKNNAYNEYISNIIPLNRTLQDIRQPGCKTDPISDDLPTASVIMCFHNEAFSVLLRGVYSIINRAPRHLIKEVLLVDDFSDMDHLFEPLYKYLRDHFGNRVRVLRNEKREGLIRSRLHGAREATGEVLIFLDSHIECSPGWLEPLLQVIKNDKTTVVTPLIDIIDKENFGYKYNKGPQISVGGFNWDMVFTWHTLPEYENSKRKSDHSPAPSPTMAGGLFAISKEYFGEIGTYDAGMEIWGGENLEISFRIWTCGGTLLTVPCSRIGHIFRDRSPYKWKPGTNVVQKNAIRCAEVWMDSYKHIYYEKRGINANVVAKENVESRRKLRKDLHCKPFKWYLDNIYPTLWNPYDSLYKGVLSTGDEYGRYSLKGEVNRKKLGAGKPAMVQAMRLSGQIHQIWYYTKENEIRVDDACLDYPNGKVNKNRLGKVLTYSCHGGKGNQEFIYKENKQIFHPLSGLCLKVSTNDAKQSLIMTDCDINDSTQIWDWKKFIPKIMDL